MRVGLQGSRLFVLVSLFTVACAQEKSPPPPSTVCPEVDAGTPVDPVLVAFLGRARAAHHRADILEDRKDLAGAARVLSELVAPNSKSPDRPEAREVIADTHARLADLKSRLGQFDAAEGEVRAGMTLAKDTSYFRGHLFEMQGLVAERRAKQLRASGDDVAAKKFEDEALQAFERAMSVQQEVIQTTLSDAGDE